MKKINASKWFFQTGREVSEEELYRKVKTYQRLYPCRPFVFFEEYGQARVRVEVFSTPAIGYEWDRTICRCGVVFYIFKHHLLHHYHEEFRKIVINL